MTPTDPTPRETPGDSRLAFGIMFFAAALLCFMLGWADGVRHQRVIFAIHQNAGWLTACVILVVIGFGFLFWARKGKRF